LPPHRITPTLPKPPASSAACLNSSESATATPTPAEASMTSWPRPRR
jgi:hypothetical protein